MSWIEDNESEIAMAEHEEINEINRLRTQLIKEQERVRVAREALEFYAANKHFNEESQDTDLTGEWFYNVKIENGEIARETLAKLGGDDEKK